MSGRVQEAFRATFRTLGHEHVMILEDEAGLIRLVGLR